MQTAIFRRLSSRSEPIRNPSAPFLIVRGFMVGGCVLGGRVDLIEQKSRWIYARLQYVKPEVAVFLNRSFVIRLDGVEEIGEVLELDVQLNKRSVYSSH